MSHHLTACLTVCTFVSVLLCAFVHARAFGFTYIFLSVLESVTLCVTRAAGVLKRLLKPTCTEPEQTWNIQNTTHTHKAKTCQGRWCDNRRAQSSSLSIGYREHFVKRGVMGNKHLAPREGLGYSPTLWCFTTPYVWACGYWLLTSDAHGQMDATPDQNRAWGDEIGLYLGFKGIKWIYIIQDEFKTRLLNPLLSGSSRDQRKRWVLILPSVNKMVFPSWLNIRSSVKK